MAGSSWTNQVVNTLIVSSGGAATGIFVYNGTPAHGNNPVFTVVAPGVTQDPFGNTVQALVNIGPLGGAHSGWDANGRQYLADATPQTRLFLDPNTSMFESFPPAGSSSPPTATIAPTAGGTDNFGHTVQGGITAYNTGTGAFAQLLGGAVGLTDASADGWTISAVKLISGTPVIEITSTIGGGGTLGIDNTGMLIAGPSAAGFPQIPNLATLAGSWANVTGEELKYKMYPDNTVGFFGQLTIPAGVTGPANAITAALGAPYRPVRLQPVLLNEHLSASPFTSTAHLGAVTTGGVLEVFGAATSGSILDVQCRYPIDN